MKIVQVIFLSFQEVEPRQSRVAVITTLQVNLAVKATLHIAIQAAAHALNANLKELSAKIAGGITEIIIKEMMRLKSFRPALIIIQIYLKEEPIVAATTEPILQSLRWSQKSEGVGLVVSTSCYHNKIKTA